MHLLYTDRAHTVRFQAWPESAKETDAYGRLPIQVAMCIDMRIDTRIDVCTDICTDMCKGMCIDMAHRHGAWTWCIHMVHRHGAYT